MSPTAPNTKPAAADPKAAVSVADRIKDLEKRLASATKELNVAQDARAALKAAHDEARAADAETKKLILASAENVKKTLHAYENSHDAVDAKQRQVNALTGELAALKPATAPKK